MAGRLEGKVAFITGGGSGIGEATAHRFAEEGATVVICGRRREPLESVAAAICAKGGKAEWVQADVSKEAEFVASIQEAAKRNGHLDVLVNNAMAFSWGGVDKTTTETWHSNFSTTVDGTFWGTRTALQIMKAQGTGGSIVNVASICGLFGVPMMAGYSAAKAAVINFSRAVASEGASRNIRCNVVIPGVVATPATADMLADEKQFNNAKKLVPMRRVGQPVELANAILFFASDESSYVTGASLSVDGGRASELFTGLA